MMQLSIRKLLLILLSTIFIPMGVVLAYNVYGGIRSELWWALSSTQDIAERTAVQVEYITLEARNVLNSLSERIIIRDVNLNHCDSIITNISDIYPQASDLILTDNFGNVICSTLPAYRYMESVANTDWFQQTISTPGLWIGEPMLNPATGEYIVIISRQIESDEALTEVIGVTLLVKTYQVYVNQEDLPDGVDINIISRTGTLISRSQEPERWLGKEALSMLTSIKNKPSPSQTIVWLDRLFQLGIEADDTIVVMNGVDGIERIYRFNQLPVSGWYVFVGIPTSVIIHTISSSVTRNGLTILGLSLFVGAMSFYFARGIAHPIRGLARAVRAVNAGKMDTRIPIEGPSEIREVAHQFNQMLVTNAFSEVLLQTSQARLTGIISTAIDAIISINDERQIILFNTAAETIFGCNEEQLLGKSIDGLFTINGREKIFQLLDASRLTRRNGLGGSSEILYGKRANGEEFPIDITISYHEMNGNSIYTIILRDITEHVRAEEKLKKSEERFRTLFNQNVDGALVLSLDGKIQFANPATETLLGYPLGELIGHRFGINAQIGPEQIIRLTNSKKGVIVLELRTTAIEWEGEMCYLIALRDITEQKRVEEGLRRAESTNRAILGALPDLIFHLSADGVYLDYHAAVEDDLIMAPEEFLGRNVTQVLSPDLAREVQDAMQVCSLGDRVGILEYQVKTQSGLAQNFEARVTKTNLGDYLFVVRNITRRKQTEAELKTAYKALAAAYNATIEGWSKALELRDQETNGHTLRVTQMTLQLARMMNFCEEELEHIRRGALLHDIGKMALPDSILFKPGPLNSEEWELMHQHPSVAYDMLVDIEYLQPALDIPLCHHERWDGTGYPRGLSGEEIPIAARIFAVADVWDALCSERPYHPAWSTGKALDYIMKQAGKQFDPNVVRVLERYVEEGSPVANLQSTSMDV
jgi:PAS domain S-box-containing protein/putative nucleotidyltransferase with HDIG domain